MPVKPPTVNKNKNPITHSCTPFKSRKEPLKVEIQLKILIPVGTAIIIVAAVKYRRVSISMPTLNM